MYFLLKMGIFHGYVSLPEGRLKKPGGWETAFFLKQIPIKGGEKWGSQRRFQQVHPLGVLSGDGNDLVSNDRCLHGTRAPKTNSQIGPKDRPFVPKGNESSSNH